MTTTTTARGSAPAAAALQMIRAEINVRDFQRWMGSRRLQDQDHATHCLLTECFGELAPKPFRLIIPRGGAIGTLYGYGGARAEEMREAAAICAEPLQARVLPADKLDSKPMPSEWTPRKVLGFEVRVRPTIRRSRNAINPGAERDVFQMEAERYPKGEMPRSREQVYIDWLATQFERSGGASLDRENTRLASFQRVRSFRQQRARYVEGPDAVMQGNLTVTDAALFAQLLARGTGRHRAYGYGMLLLRQPRR